MAVSLVTGGAGFLGSHVAKYLLHRGDQVIVVDDLSGGFRENVPQGAVFEHGDIVDRSFVQELFSKYEIDYIYHLAAYAAEGLSHFIRHFNYTNNVLGSVNLINSAVNSNVERFVFTSSIAVYGSSRPPMTEDMHPEPEDPYGIAKYAVELDLRAAHEQFGLEYTIFRPHNVYGEHQNIGDRYRNVVGIFMNQLMQGLPMTVFGDGTQTRAFSYIDDVAPVIARCTEWPETVCEVFNIGGDRPYTVLELAHTVAEAFGVEPTIEHLPARNEVIHAYASHEKIKSVIGETESVDLFEGISRMARWARKVGPRRAKRFEGVEVERNMPEVWLSEIRTDGAVG